MPAAHPVVKAALWMSGTLASFMIMAVAVRELSEGLHAFQMLFVRSGVGLAIVAVALSLSGWHHLRTRHLTGHLLRNSVHYVGQALWVFGIQLLPLATVFAIEFTTPIWAAFLAVLFLGERMNAGRWLALGLGFAGILVILRPGVAPTEPALAMMIVCALFFAVSVTMTKWLTRWDHPLAIMFYMTAIQLVLGLVASLFVWAPMTLAQWPWLILLGITGLSAHYCMVRAFGHADATVVMPMDFLRLPLIALVGFLVYAEALDWITLAGAALICAGNYASVRRETRESTAS